MASTYLWFLLTLSAPQLNINSSVKNGQVCTSSQEIVRRLLLSQIYEPDRHQTVRIGPFFTQIEQNCWLIDPANSLPGRNQTAISTRSVSQVRSKMALPLNCRNYSSAKGPIWVFQKGVVRFKSLLLRQLAC